MTEYRWSTTLDRGIDLFGETPGQQLEAELLTAFQQQPARIHSTIESVGAQILAGANIRNGWAIVRKRIRDAPEDVVVQDSTQTERKIVNARRWLHNAGCYVDMEADVMDELFGQQGMLRDHDSEQLRAEMAEAWRQERKRGVAAEAEHLAYMAKVKADRARIEQAKKDRLAELDAIQAKGAK